MLNEWSKSLADDTIATLLAVSKRWDGMSLWWRNVWAFVSIILISFLTPCSVVFEYHLDVCALALSVALAWCLFSRSNYYHASLLGLVIGSGIHYHNSWGDSFLALAVAECLTILVTVTCVRRLQIKLINLETFKELAAFICWVLVFPCLFTYLLVLAMMASGFVSFGFTDPFCQTAMRLIMHFCIANLLGSAIVMPLVSILAPGNKVVFRLRLRIATALIIISVVMSCFAYTLPLQRFEMGMRNFKDWSTGVRLSIIDAFNKSLDNLRMVELQLQDHDTGAPHSPSWQVKTSKDITGYFKSEQFWNIGVVALYVPRNQRQQFENTFSSIVDKNTHKPSAAQDYYLPVIAVASRVPRSHETLQNNMESADNIAHEESTGLEGLQAGIDVSTVPVIQSIMQDLEEYRAKHSQSKRLHDVVIYKTSGNAAVLAKWFYEDDAHSGLICAVLDHHDSFINIVRRYTKPGTGVRISTLEAAEGESSHSRVICDRLYDSTDFVKVSYVVRTRDVSGLVLSDLPIYRIDCSYSPALTTGFSIIQTLDIIVCCMIGVGIVGLIVNSLFIQLCHTDDIDVNRVQELDTRVHFYRRIIGTICEGLFYADLDGKVLYANPVACSLVGQQLSELVGKNVHEVLHHNQDCLQSHSCTISKYLHELRAAVTNATEDSAQFDRHLREVIFDRDGKAQQFDSHFVVVRVRNEVRFVINCRSIEDELRNKKLRSDYVANLSHDMRSPLSCVKGTIDMFASHADKLIDGGAKLTSMGDKMLEVASRNVNKLSDLISDILLYDSVENGTLHLCMTPQDLAPIVTKVVENNMNLAHAKKIELRLHDIPGRGVVDELRLDQILTNLISNAVKYSPTGSIINIGATYSADMEFVRFFVSDSGEGIPEHKRIAIFSRFEVTNDDSVRKHGGLGLGLAIARGLVKAHGGNIWVESKVGVGTTFFFTIPVAKTDDNSVKESVAHTE